MISNRFCGPGFGMGRRRRDRRHAQWRIGEREAFTRQGSNTGMMTPAPDRRILLTDGVKLRDRDKEKYSKCASIARWVPQCFQTRLRFRKNMWNVSAARIPDQTANSGPARAKGILFLCDGSIRVMIASADTISSPAGRPRFLIQSTQIPAAGREALTRMSRLPAG